MEGVASNDLRKRFSVVDGVPAIVHRAKLSSAASSAHGNPIGTARLGDARSSSARSVGEPCRTITQGTVDEDRTVSGMVEAVSITRPEPKAKTVKDGARDTRRDREAAVAKDRLHCIWNGVRLEIGVPLVDALSKVLATSGCFNVRTTPSGGANNHLVGLQSVQQRVALTTRRIDRSNALVSQRMFKSA